LDPETLYSAFFNRFREWQNRKTQNHMTCTGCEMKSAAFQAILPNISRNIFVGDSIELSLDPKDWNAFRQLAHKALDEALEFVESVRERPVWQPLTSGNTRPVDGSTNSSGQPFFLTPREMCQDSSDGCTELGKSATFLQKTF
jgi:hypothetical protein